MPPMPRSLCNREFPKGVRPKSSKEAFLWGISKLKRARTFAKQKLTPNSDTNHYAAGVVLPGSTSLICRSAASHSGSSLRVQKSINGEVLHWF